MLASFLYNPGITCADTKASSKCIVMQKGFCEWKQDEFDEYNLWETDCGKLFCIEDGTPKENDMNFCCYCGKKLKQMVV